MPKKRVKFKSKNSAHSFAENLRQEGKDVVLHTEPKGTNKDWNFKVIFENDSNHQSNVDTTDMENEFSS